MKVGYILLLFMVTSLPLNANPGDTPDPQRQIFQGTMLEIREKAKTEDKAYILQFTAKWCMPCRWMEATTYKDERVVNYIGENFLSARIDIDDFDGYAWKEYYGIKALPTLLIFSPDGQLLEKRENSLSPSQLLALLENINENPEVATASAEADENEKNSAAVEHISFLQFGIFSDEKNARKCYEQVSKSLTFPIEIEEQDRGGKMPVYIVRSELINDPDTEMSRITLCDQKGVNYLVKLKSDDRKPDRTEHQKDLSRLGANATL